MFAAANLEAAKAQNRRVDTSLKIVARPTITNLSQFYKVDKMLKASQILKYSCKLKG